MLNPAILAPVHPSSLGDALDANLAIVDPLFSILAGPQAQHPPTSSDFHGSFPPRTLVNDPNTNKPFRVL